MTHQKTLQEIFLQAIRKEYPDVFIKKMNSLCDRFKSYQMLEDFDRKLLHGENVRRVLVDTLLQNNKISKKNKWKIYYMEAYSRDYLFHASTMGRVASIISKYNISDVLMASSVLLKSKDELSVSTAFLDKVKNQQNLTWHLAQPTASSLLNFSPTEREKMIFFPHQVTSLKRVFYQSAIFRDDQKTLQLEVVLDPDLIWREEFKSAQFLRPNLDDRQSLGELEKKWQLSGSSLTLPYLYAKMQVN